MWLLSYGFYYPLLVGDNLAKASIVSNEIYQDNLWIGHELIYVK